MAATRQQAGSGTNGTNGSNPTANSLNPGGTSVMENPGDPASAGGQQNLFAEIDQRRQNDIATLKGLYEQSSTSIASLNEQREREIAAVREQRAGIRQRLQSLGEVVEGDDDEDANVGSPVVRNKPGPKPGKRRGGRPKGSKNKPKVGVVAKVKGKPGRKAGKDGDLPDTQKVLRVIQSRRKPMSASDINEAVKELYPRMESKKIEAALQALRGRRIGDKIVGIPKIKKTGQKRHYMYSAI